MNLTSHTPSNDQPDVTAACVTDQMRQHPSRLLSVLHVLPNLPRRPVLSVCRNGNGYVYHKLQVRIPCAGTQTRRKELYVGQLTPYELGLLREEIDYLWPPDERRLTEKYITLLKERRRTVREIVGVLANKCGCGMRGYEMNRRKGDDNECTHQD